MASPDEIEAAQRAYLLADRAYDDEVSTHLGLPTDDGRMIGPPEVLTQQKLDRPVGLKKNKRETQIAFRTLVEQ